MVKQLL